MTTEWILIVWLCATSVDLICDPVGSPKVVASYESEKACLSVLSKAIDDSIEMLFGVCLPGADQAAPD